MTTKIKICGVTRPDDAARTVAAGADYLGLNFWPSSRRHVAADRAVAIAAAARSAGSIELVGVFVDASLAAIRDVIAIVDLDAIQVHGDETPEAVAAIAAATGRPVWRSIAVGSPADLDGLDAWPDTLLLDTPSVGRGGTGRTFDWTLAAAARSRYPTRRILLAGGLDPGNVDAAIAAVGPFGVDVASGVESAPGIKDPAKVVAFIAAVRASDL